MWSKLKLVLISTNFFYIKIRLTFQKNLSFLYPLYLYEYKSIRKKGDNGYIKNMERHCNI